MVISVPRDGRYHFAFAEGGSKDQWAASRMSMFDLFCGCSLDNSACDPYLRECLKMACRLAEYGNEALIIDGRAKSILARRLDWGW